MCLERSLTLDPQQIWCAAQDDPNAYPLLRAGLENGLIDTLYPHRDLAHNIRALQPTSTQAESALARPSVAMLSSFASFICSAMPAVKAFLGATFARPPSADDCRRLSPIADAIGLELLQYFRPVDPYLLVVLDVRSVQLPWSFRFG